MQKAEQLYEGKAKKVFKTEEPEVLIALTKMTRLHLTVSKKRNHCRQRSYQQQNE